MKKNKVTLQLNTLTKYIIEYIRRNTRFYTLLSKIISSNPSRVLKYLLVSVRGQAGRRNDRDAVY